jgi:mono/diheme cytochrome c family protein
MRDVAMMVRHFIAMFLATVATLTMASAAPADEAADQALVKQGEYVARTGDFIACHTSGKPHPFQPPPGADARIARGAYLVEVPGHCGACHTPRSFTLQEKALCSSDGTVYLSGGSAVDGWIPPRCATSMAAGLPAGAKATSFNC